MSVTAPGRPRAFDTEAALDAALHTFWRQGYEGTSVNDLATAMGINKPSLYAAFGNKRKLFARVLERYAQTDLAYATEALTRATARQVIESFLRGNVRAVTRSDRPPGCFSVQSGLASRPDNSDVSEALAGARAGGEAALRDRLVAAHEAGELWDGVSPEGLARYLSVISEGLAVHAAAGTAREELDEVVDIVLRTIPLTT